MSTVQELVQQLNPGSILEFFELDLTPFDGDVLRFHGHMDGPLIWQAEEYSPWPIQAEGFTRTSTQPARPKLKVANVDRSISMLCASYQDCVGAVLTRKRTFKGFLDAVNFPGGVNPTANPDEEFQHEIWIVDRKSLETREFVEFELASAMEFNNAQLPGRQIIANFCSWIAIGGYRGPYCGYSGPPVATRADVPTSDPDLDHCGGRVPSCKLRFGEAGKLPFGGYPAAGLVRV